MEPEVVKDLIQWCIDTGRVESLKLGELEVRLSSDARVLSAEMTTEEALAFLQKPGRVDPEQLLTLAKNINDSDQYYSSK